MKIWGLSPETPRAGGSGAEEAAKTGILAVFRTVQTAEWEWKRNHDRPRVHYIECIEHTRRRECARHSFARQALFVIHGPPFINPKCVTPPPPPPPYIYISLYSKELALLGGLPSARIVQPFQILRAPRRGVLGNPETPGRIYGAPRVLSDTRATALRPELPASLPSPPPHAGRPLRYKLSPLELTFDENERGKRVYFAVRWESGTVKKGPWSNILSAVIP
jgi:hypothetical protein